MSTKKLVIEVEVSSGPEVLPKTRVLIDGEEIVGLSGIEFVYRLGSAPRLTLSRITVPEVLDDHD